MATLSPYLNFRNSTREAIEFYHSVFGGTLDINTFADFGVQVEPSESGLVMHSQLETPSGFTIMAADVPSHMAWSQGENTFSVSISGSDAEKTELTGYFDKLAEGGEVAQPLTASPWDATFGMLTDRFGVNWLVNIAGPES